MNSLPQSGGENKSPTSEFRGNTSMMTTNSSGGLTSCPLPVASGTIGLPSLSSLQGMGTPSSSSSAVSSMTGGSARYTIKDGTSSPMNPSGTSSHQMQLEVDSSGRKDNENNKHKATSDKNNATSNDKTVKKKKTR